MSDFQLCERLLYLDKLLDREATGTPEQLAARLGVSQSVLDQPPVHFPEWGGRIIRLITVFSVISFLAFIPQLWGQTTYLKGVLMDQETQMPIAYASLSPTGQPRLGTLSNGDGAFMLKFPAGIDSIAIRHLNYGRLTLEVATLGDTIWLKPVPIELDEVPIFSERPQELWERVLDNLRENHYHKGVSYQVDGRSMFYSPDRQKAYYLSQARAYLHYDSRKGLPVVNAVRMSRRPLSWAGQSLEEERYMVMHEVPGVHLFANILGRTPPIFKRSSLREFEIEVLRSFTQDGRELAEIRLVPKDEEKTSINTFLIDLETYGLLKARNEGMKDGKYKQWTELFFEEQGGKYFITYLNRRYFNDAYRGKPFYHHIIASLSVVEGAPRKGNIGYMKLCWQPVDDYKIAWDDPAWQESSMVPWPDWIVEQMEHGELTQKKDAPAWRLTTLQGDSLALADLRGKIVLLDFWFVGCIPCVKAMPHLQQIHDDYQDQGVVVVGFNPTGQDPQQQVEFLQKQGVSYPVVHSTMDAGWPERYQVEAYPTLWLINRQGRLIHREVGFAGERSAKELRRWVEEQLAE